MSRKANEIFTSLAFAFLVANPSLAQPQPEASPQRGPAPVVPHEVVEGPAGDVILNGSIAPYGVYIRANNSSLPSIRAQLGADTGAHFAVVNASGVHILNVFPSGLLQLNKDQLGDTFLAIGNGNAGTTATSASTALRFFEGSLKAAINSYGSGSTAALGGANALTIWNYANGAMLFGTNNVEHLRIEKDGPVVIQPGTWTGLSAHFSHAVAEGLPAGVLMTMGGNSAIKVSNLELGFATLPVLQSNPLGTTALYLNYNSNNDVVIGKTGHNKGLKVEGNGPSSFAGSVTVTGDMSVTGNIAAKYQDLAEWVPSVEKLRAGTVVVLDAERSNHVLTSSRAYDTGVAGVVSAQPGIALGEAGDSKALIATTGRVRVRADASRHPIAIGDLLVTSSRPGLAMKSIPLDLQGVAIHRPGTVVGKALEPLASGEGEILVLLSLQ